MKILLLTTNFYPEKTGISITATDCARFLSQLGHEVTVICGMPYYPEWNIQADYKGKMFLTEKLDTITVKRNWLYVPKRPSSMKRIIHELSFSVLAFFRGLMEPCDMILSVSPPLTAAFSARIVSIVRRKEMWVSVKDIQPDAAIELGMLKNAMLIQLLFMVEKFIYSGSKKILILSEGMKRNLIRKGVEDARLQIVPDSIEVTEASSHQAKKNDFWKRFGLGEKYVVTYSGNVGVKQDPAILVECAKLLQHNDEIFFAIVGDGAMRSTIEQRIQEYGLHNIRLFPLVKRKELWYMLGSSRILLAPQKKAVVDFVMPSKLLAYFSSGTPVIAAAHRESEIASVLLSSKTGILVEPENPQALVDAIISLKNNPSLPRQLAESASQYVASRHSHEVVREKYYRPLFEVNVRKNT